MQHNMTSLVSELSGNDFDTLSQIISLQYKKFTNFYWLIKDHSDAISSIVYTFVTQSSLDVDLNFNNKSDAKKIASELSKSVTNSTKYDGSVTHDNKTIHISIELDESMTP